MTDFVQCMLCRKYFRIISHSHLRTHGYTIQDYKEAFPDALLFAPSYLDTKNKSIAKALKGKRKSEQHRAHISEAAKRRMARPEERAKVSAVHKGKVYTPEQRAMYSAIAKAYYRAHPEAHPNRRIARVKGYTSLERLVRRSLDRYAIGREFEYNYRVGQYFIDFAHPKLKIGIECDGAYWHQDKFKDIKRDQELASVYGYKIYRFDEMSIKNCVDALVDKVIEQIAGEDTV